jgi:hypothetical protein
MRSQPLSLAEVFRTRVSVAGPEQCWLWTGRLTADGYGRFSDAHAHRWVYEHLVAPIAPGLVLDHLCHNADAECDDGRACLHRRCVNPAHLEPVSSWVNSERGRSPIPLNAAKTSCVNGHEFDAENTYVRPNGHRDCRACIRDRARAYAARRRSAA